MKRIDAHCTLCQRPAIYAADAVAATEGDRGAGQEGADGPRQRRSTRGSVVDLCDQYLEGHLSQRRPGKGVSLGIGWSGEAAQSAGLRQSVTADRYTRFRLGS